MTLFQALLYFLREAAVGLARSWKVSLLAVLTIAVSLFLGGSNPAANILRRPVVEASAMDTLTAGAWSGGENAVVVGDFMNYGIVDAAATMVQSIPVVVGANQRPTGEQGWAWFKWVGADVLNADAFRLLQVTS